jgi:hypothetical protein
MGIDFQHDTRTSGLSFLSQMKLIGVRFFLSLDASFQFSEARVSLSHQNNEQGTCNFA